MEFSKPAIRVEDTRTDLNLDEKKKLLEVFPLENKFPQLIEIHTAEFSAVCPGTGLPDIAVIDIEYIPSKLCIELKSLKFYFFSFRNDPIFQEPVTDIIFGHLLEVLQPNYLKISVQYNIRGGFLTTTHAQFGEKNFSVG